MKPLLSLLARRLLWLLCLVGAAAPATAQEVRLASAQDGSTVTVNTPFENMQAMGVRPMDIRIENRDERRWDVSITSNRSGSVASIHWGGSFKVKAKETLTFPLIAPVPPSYSYIYLNLVASSPGSSGGHGEIGLNNRGSSTPDEASGRMVAMSPALVLHSYQPLIAETDKKKRPLNITQLYLPSSSMPSVLEDWRAWEGIDFLFITPAEWRSLSPRIQAALEAWLTAGGVAIFPTRNEGEALPIGAAALPGRPARIGFGEVRRLIASTTPIPPESLLGEIGTNPSRASTTNSENTPQAMDARFGKTSQTFGLALSEIPRTTVLIFTIALAALLGPVNLFYLAPAGRRHRLFVTTPLLSVAGSVLMLGVILLKDGTGARGQSFSLHRFIAGKPEAVVLHHQMTSTGLLLSSKVTLPPHVLPTFKYQSNQNNNPAFELTPEGATGTWYRSRSIQLLELAQLRSSRAEITQVGTSPEGAPIVLSSLPAPAKTLYLHDASGRFWTGENIGTGQRATLKPANARDFTQWIRALREGKTAPTTRVNQLLTQLEHPRDTNTWYALSEETEPVTPLPSIRWKESEALLVGPLNTAQTREVTTP